MSFLLVMPISRMLFSESTPSILVSSWLTMESLTPVPLLQACRSAEGLQSWHVTQGLLQMQVSEGHCL